MNQDVCGMNTLSTVSCLYNVCMYRQAWSSWDLSLSHKTSQDPIFKLLVQILKLRVFQSQLSLFDRLVKLKLRGFFVK